ncbi:hypothetical protein Psi02_49770 [Planotetraspora silvatica]|uniref:Uncharacterized protein n=1 Tax=Planotetraspora silvatica TaxID=234614 RepID=A0A8J3UMC9_9ACTN|nr:hypothetical protein Psi02_49770 [Planotetraspora silvatica]
MSSEGTVAVPPARDSAQATFDVLSPCRSARRTTGPVEAAWSHGGAEMLTPSTLRPGRPNIQLIKVISLQNGVRRQPHVNIHGVRVGIAS